MISEQIVTVVKGVTPYLIGFMFALCIVICAVRQLELPGWFIALLSSGTGSGVTGYITTRKSK